MASEVLEKIDRARVMIARLNYGEREWKMSIPARDDDPDVVIMEALRCASLEIARLARELEEAQRQRDEANRRHDDMCREVRSLTKYLFDRNKAVRELEAARKRERHIEEQIVALVEAEVISEGKAREILGVGVDEWREIEDRILRADTDT